MTATLVLPLEDVVGQRAERDGPLAERSEPLLGPLDQELRLAARGLEAVHRGIGRLLLALVAARRLAELLETPFDVEDVVDDLEREPELTSRLADRPDRPRVTAAEERAHAQGGADERRRLVPVDVLEGLGADRLALRLDVHHLAADHPES